MNKFYHLFLYSLILFSFNSFYRDLCAANLNSKSTFSDASTTVDSPERQKKEYKSNSLPFVPESLEEVTQEIENNDYIIYNNLCEKIDDETRKKMNENDKDYWLEHDYSVRKDERCYEKFKKDKPELKKEEIVLRVMDGLKKRSVFFYSWVASEIRFKQRSKEKISTGQRELLKLIHSHGMNNSILFRNVTPKSSNGVKLSDKQIENILGELI